MPHFPPLSSLYMDVARLFVLVLPLLEFQFRSEEEEEHGDGLPDDQSF